MRLKFEFYDNLSGKRIPDPDTTSVYLSPTVTCPSQDNSLVKKTDFRDPYIIMYRDLQGKVIPEFYNAATKKDRHPQQVYLTLKSMSGCVCTVTVSFPCEKRQLAQQNQQQRPQLAKTSIKRALSNNSNKITAQTPFNASQQGSLSVVKNYQQKHFQEIKEIVRGTVQP